MNHSILRLVYFIFLIILNFTSFIWMREQIRISASVTREEEWEFWLSVRHKSKAQKYKARWLLHRSPNPSKTRRQMDYFTLCTAPGAFGSFFAACGLFSDHFDGILSVLSIVTPILSVIGIVQGWKHDPHFLRRFWRQEKYYLNKTKELDTENISSQPRGSRLLALFIFLALMVLFLFLALNPFSRIEPVTAQQVTAMLTAHGYSPTDMTQSYRDYWESDEILEAAISAEKDGVTFLYFDVDTGSHARSVLRQYLEFIREDWVGRPRSNDDYTEYDLKHYIYTVTYMDMYTVLIQIEDTVVYAFTDETNAEAVRELIRAIGYFG